MQKILTFIQKNALHLAFVIALTAMLGSLYFSDIKGYAPCVLCWYQRICMYSLVPICLAGFFRGDSKIYHYVMPLASLGYGIALYHVLLYMGVIKNEELCAYGISCTSKYVEYFGFITIPLMSFTAFSLILMCCVLYRRWMRKSSKVI